MNRIAFTLAEVLITLGIIGVVAAMTMPTILNNTRNKELESQLKVAYSTIQGGISQMNASKGISVTPKDFEATTVNPDAVSGSDGSVSGIFYNEYKKYFSKIYDCGIFNTDEKICISRGHNDTIYKTYTGNTLATRLFDDGQFVLPNGMLVIINNSGSTNDPLFISVDINGKKKKPNKLGQDLFTFQLMNNGKLLPMGAEGTDYTELNQFCSASSTSNINGIGCTNKALTDSNYFKNLPK